MIQITLFGYIGQDADLRTVQTSNGPQEVLQFSLGVKTNDKDSDGRWISRWFRCSMWGPRAAKLDQYFRKGTPLIVIGDHSIKIDVGNNGKQYVNENITVKEFSFAGKGTDNSASGPASSGSSSYQTQQPSIPMSEPADDLPF